MSALIDDSNGIGLGIWTRLEAEVERLKIEAVIRYEKNLASSNSLHRDASLVQEGQRLSYQKSLDLIRDAKRNYERNLL